MRGEHEVIHNVFEMHQSQTLQQFETGKSLNHLF